ncbi:preprotein translocase subunit YajC [Bdellovibrio sp. qaytius]|nr:preprotein translocase subunit YajC [Bdellovibrio sp. qaytius]
MLSMGLSAFAQEATTAATTAAQPPAWMQFVPMLAIVVVFYFFLIRPQAKKQKEQQGFLSALKVGDQVVTQSGLFGKITGLNEQIANLEISNGVTIKLLRSQITMLQSALMKTETAK